MGSTQVYIPAFIVRDRSGTVREGRAGPNAGVVLLLQAPVREREIDAAFQHLVKDGGRYRAIDENRR